MTTTTTDRQTRITADPDVPLVRIVREFDAPPSRSFVPTSTRTWSRDGWGLATSR